MPEISGMSFVGRSAELGRLRYGLDRRTASILRITGIRGGGKSALVRRVLGDYGHLVHQAPPLPDLDQRRALMARITRARADRGWSPHLEASAPSWDELLRGLLAAVPSGGRPFVLVLDDLHRLAQARSRHISAVTSLVEAARAERRPLHVALVGPEDSMPTEDALPADAPDPIRVGPLPLRSARALLPGARPHDLLRAYGIFGGIPRVLRCLDPQVALGTNLRRLVLAENAALSDAGAEWLERDVQAPARYYAILGALTHGEADWSTLHSGVADLTRSGQLAPYVSRLEQLGLLVSRRSLDAAAGTRSRRYALGDPFLATWLRFVLLSSAGGASVPSSDTYAVHVHPHLADHLARAFPVMCRQHVAHDAIETIGATAREAGSLWGHGYDLPVAGILTSGAAFYGTCHWHPIERRDAPLTTLDRQLRETRYGFGRERRIRLVFTASEAPGWLQRDIARRHDARLVDAADLVGT